MINGKHDLTRGPKVIKQHDLTRSSEVIKHPSTQHEIYHAQNVKMSTVVGILTI